MDHTESSGLSPSSLTFLAASEHLSTSTFDHPPPFATTSQHNDTLHDADGSGQGNGIGVGQSRTGLPVVAQATVPIAGPSRKQNVACDACRAKKIRCQRISTAEICGQCSVKGSECTSHYIEQLALKAKTSKKSRESIGDRDGAIVKKRKVKTVEDGVGETSDAARRASSGSVGALGANPRLQAEDPFAVPQSSRRTTLASQDDMNQLSHRYYHNPARPPSDLRPSEKQANLVRYLLSPQAVSHSFLGYNDLSSTELCETGFSDIWEEQGGRVWKEDPTEAHTALTDVGTRELSDDLVESFFSLAHSRFSMFDPPSIRARLANPDTHPQGPVPHNLLAVLIAFGARFSDHPVINADREECMGRDEAAYGAGQRPPRSRIVQLLVIRAREVLDVQKTMRISTINNTQVLVLAEALFAPVFAKEKFYFYYFGTAVHHACTLGYNTAKGLLAITNPKERNAANFVWRFICAVDGFHSVFYRQRSRLTDAGYDKISPESDFVPDEHNSNGHKEVRGVQVSRSCDKADLEPIVWSNASAAASMLCRQLCSDLWNKTVPLEGISISALETFVESCTAWRDQHLSRLGVPSEWPASASFDAAITACSSDAFYHTLWLSVERAIRDFGIKELRTIQPRENPELATKIETLRNQIRVEAEHGAIRISSLTSVLALNQYLRLDPLILNHPIYEAGLFLAEQGREECMASVAGLRQYCIAYPQFWSQAEEIDRLYQARSHTRPTINTSAPGSFGRNEPSDNSGNGGQVGPPSGTGTDSSTPFVNPPGEHTDNASLGLDGGLGESVVSGEMDISMALFQWLHQS